MKDGSDIFDMVSSLSKVLSSVLSTTSPYSDGVCCSEWGLLEDYGSLLTLSWIMLFTSRPPMRALRTAWKS